MPDETATLRFRHWLKDCHLGQDLFGRTADILRKRGVLMKQGTSVDSTLTDAPSSTRNKAKERAPDMHSTRKGKNWRFGMKAHIGVDRDSGVVHSLAVTSANGSDVVHAPSVLHGKEQEVLGDAGYQGLAEREQHRDREVSWKIAMHPGKRRKLPKDSAEAHAEKAKSSARGSVEHPFHFLKCQFEYRKVRYRGLRKNHNRLLVLFALANLHIGARGAGAHA